MKKFLFVLLFFVIFFNNLSANKACQKLFKKQTFTLEKSGYLSWILDEKHSVFFSPDRPDENYIKHNPMLGLYLVEHKKKSGTFKPIIVRKIKSKPRYAMDENTHIKGYTVKRQIGLDLAIFSEPVFDNLVITGGCCTIAGLTIGGERFIETDFIFHFLKTDQIYYSTIGARFSTDSNNSIIVNRVNPFFNDNQFKLNDKILTIDGNPVPEYEEFLKKILFSKQGQTLKLQVERKGHIFDLEVETRVLLGGGLISDTFLENLGIWFDDEFYVNNIHSKSLFAKRGLKNNYRLLSINNKTFETLADIQKYLSDSSEKMPSSFNFLFEHNSFQFFINLKNNKKSEDPFGTNWGGQHGVLNSNYKKKTSSQEVQNIQEDPFSNYSNGNRINSLAPLDENSKEDEDTNQKYFEIYNKIPLGEYLSL
jgi:hypothetical protein